MLSYITRRLGYALLTFVGITIATFILIHAVPGDPLTFRLGQHGRQISPALIQAVRHEYHLDQPLATQYAWWLRGAITLDFGRSVIDNRPVTDVIARKLPNTFELNLIAFVLSALIGIPIGLWSASHSGRLAERASAVFFFLLYSLPAFWIGLLLMEFFAVRLNILPLMGMRSDQYANMSVSQQVADHFRHLVLPVITLSYAQIAVFARFSKSALTEVIRQDFITTARAKGVSDSLVLWHHALRNALVPLVTLFGLTIPTLISGSVIIETIFEWDGIGRLYYDSILSRDYPTVLGLTVATAVVTLLASVIADVLYAVVDPRIRLDAAGE